MEIPKHQTGLIFDAETAKGFTGYLQGFQVLATYMPKFTIQRGQQ